MAFRARWHRRHLRLASFKFAVESASDRAVPAFAPASLNPAFIGEPHRKARMTVFGHESLSLIHIQEIVDYLEYHLGLKEALEWEAVRSPHRARNEFVAVLQTIDGNGGQSQG